MPAPSCSASGTGDNERGAGRFALSAQIAWMASVRGSAATSVLKMRNVPRSLSGVVADALAISAKPIVQRIYLRRRHREDRDRIAARRHALERRRDDVGDAEAEIAGQADGDRERAQRNTAVGVRVKPPNEIIGRTLKDLLRPIYPLNLPYIEGALRGEPQEFERETPDPNGGRSRFTQARYVPDIEGGVVRGVFVLVTDITVRKQMEEDLRREHRAEVEALAKVRLLEGLLPICAWCRRMGTIEDYVASQTNTTLTHGICEACAEVRPKLQRYDSW